jgi:3-hydroxyacyl-CoA dehydrogenase/enoyl-CoA hydratase/3-hydroxybutyryl-CoA epimerase
MTTQDLTADTCMIGWERGADGIVVLTMDDPAGSANTMNDTYLQAMGATVDRLEAEIAADPSAVSGVVLTSAKKTFFAGGNLDMIIAAGPAQAAAMTAFIDGVKAQLRRLETLGRPVVAAINGAALGGGLEIALACHHRIALDAPGSLIGLPEVTLGLLPGAGGVTRTVRLLGITDALLNVLLQGPRHSPRRALELGLVHEVVDTPEDLLARAKAWIAEHPDAVQPWDVKGFRIPGGTPATPAFAANLPAFPANLRKQLRGAPLPAPRNILAAAVEGAQVDFDTASFIETRYVVELIVGQISKNMIKSTFFDMQEVNGGASRPGGYDRYAADTVAVLGAGMMGAGIAYVCARAGINVLLSDVSTEAAAKGKAHSENLVSKAVSRGGMTREAADELLARITPTAAPGDLAGAGLVIEAVFENTELKQQVFADIIDIVAPDALLASNTSTLPITGLAQGLSRPEDFIGLHFFSPVDKMPLLEIIVGEKTSDATLAKAFDFARQIRKVPIVVNDSRGFFTSRVISAFLNEAVAMVGEGVHPQSIEQAATQAGYPVGPLALMDELTLTLPRKIRTETRQAVEAAGGTWEPHPAEAVTDRMIDDFDRTGRKDGAGFYDYADGGRAGLWPGLREHFGTGADPAAADLRDLGERMLFAEALETVKCFDEGVLRSVAEANIGSTLGIGFPPWTGGCAQYIEQYQGGVAGFVARAEQLATGYGERFTPPASLVERARG